MADLDDIQSLGALDARHTFVKRLSTADLVSFTYFIARDAVSQPVMAILSRAPVQHPLRPTAGRQIIAIVADLTRPALALRRALIQCCLSVTHTMSVEGIGYAWGIVPTAATHLTTLLDLMVVNAVASKNPGNVLNGNPAAPSGMAIDPAAFSVYAADREGVRLWLEAL